jgi:hypothetical protein
MTDQPKQTDPDMEAAMASDNRVSAGEQIQVSDASQVDAVNEGREAGPGRRPRSPCSCATTGPNGAYPDGPLTT